MASRLIELSCQRFRQGIETEIDRQMQSLQLADVRQGVLEIQTYLRAKQSLRNLDRLSPYLDAVDRYSKAASHLCNGVPFLPYVWAPLMIILRAVRDQTQALDKILGAYAQIGNCLPRLERYQATFSNDTDFQRLLAFLFEDITEFHTKALALLRKPAWKMFFTSSWGRFEQRFGAILESIGRTSALIDTEAASRSIVEMREWRQDVLEKAAAAEKRWESEQFQALMRWLETSDMPHQSRYDWLRDRACEGTGSWILSHTKFRAWMGRQRGNPVLWMNGKPGSGKSVLCSQIVRFLQADKNRHVVFIFGTRQTHLSSYDIQTHIMRAIVAQLLRLNNDMVALLYDRYLAKSQPSSALVLRGFLVEILHEFEELHMVVDGVDELPATEHKAVINDLVTLVKKSNGSLKLLISSQDIPSIRPSLAAKPTLPLSHEKKAVAGDIAILVESAMDDLSESFGGALPDRLKGDLTTKILEKSDGMILWVHLVFSLLRFSSSFQELRACVEDVPPDLKSLYRQILNNITARCTSPFQLNRVKRIFGWLIFSKDGPRAKKHDILIGSTLCPGTETIDADSRPFPTSLDICKPLIEDGPHGTATIVHSTVTEHLLSPESGPFINERDATYSLAFACVSQTVNSLDLALTNHHDEQLLQVCLGLYGLHDYAEEYWISHVLDAMAIGHQDGRAPLTQLLGALCQKHAEVAARLGIPEPQSYSPTAAEKTDEMLTAEELERLSHIPELGNLIIHVKTRRAHRADAFRSTGASAACTPRSALEFVDNKYRELARQILGPAVSRQLPAEEVLAFQQQYATTAYPCPHDGCGRRRFGFISFSELEDHLVTDHSPGFKCYQHDCGYNDVGFPSRRSLQAHVRKYHVRAKPRTIPKTIRRSQRSISRTATNLLTQTQVEESWGQPRSGISPAHQAIGTGEQLQDQWWGLPEDFESGFTTARIDPRDYPLPRNKSTGKDEIDLGSVLNTVTAPSQDHPESVWGGGLLDSQNHLAQGLPYLYTPTEIHAKEATQAQEPPLPLPRLVPTYRYYSDLKKSEVESRPMNSQADETERIQRQQIEYQNRLYQLQPQQQNSLRQQAEQQRRLNQLRLQQDNRLRQQAEQQNRVHPWTTEQRGVRNMNNASGQQETERHSSTQNGQEAHSAGAATVTAAHPETYHNGAQVEEPQARLSRAHVLQDYQMQLMLAERKNKKQLMAKRAREQEAITNGEESRATDL